MRKWLTILAASIGLVLGQAVPAAADTTSFDAPTALFLVNPCNGDLVFVSGAIHIVVVTNEAQGNYHVYFHFNSSGVTGVDQDGTKYTYVVRESASITAQAGAAFEQTISNSGEMISQGPDPNFVVVNLFHWTFDANGNLTSYTNTMTTSCH